jgi:osmotically-inducible protein OsmY
MKTVSCKYLFIGGTALTLALSGTGSLAADTASQAITNARQEAQIGTTYALSSYLRANDLVVSVQDGKATLTGKVDEPVNKELATEIALGVSGIKDVDNQIIVQSDYQPAAKTGRSYGDVVDDAGISAAVKSKLLWSKNAEGLTAKVTTVAGKVTLTGTADSVTSKNVASSLAENTRGVASVDNQLVVDANKKASKTVAGNKAGNAVSTGTMTDVSDGWITTKVKSTFMYSRNVDSSNISVSTHAGVVTLTGKLDSGAERALAIELAKNVRGVKSVQANGLVI